MPAGYVEPPAMFYVVVKNTERYRLVAGPTNCLCEWIPLVEYGRWSRRWQPFPQSWRTLNHIVPHGRVQTKHELAHSLWWYALCTFRVHRSGVDLFSNRPHALFEGPIIATRTRTRMVMGRYTMPPPLSLQCPSAPPQHSLFEFFYPCSTSGRVVRPWRSSDKTASVYNIVPDLGLKLKKTPHDACLATCDRWFATNKSEDAMTSRMGIADGACEDV